MAITRRVNHKEEPYVRIYKTVSENRSLSWAARGILVYLLGKPDHWRISIQDLVNQTDQSRKQTGRDGIYALLKELIDAGYVVVVQSRDAGKFGAREYIVSDTPEDAKAISPLTDSPLTDSPLTPEPLAVETTLVMNDLKQVMIEEVINEEKINKKAVANAPIPVDDIIKTYHKILPELPKVRLPKTVEAAIIARWKDHKDHQSLEYWGWLFNLVRKNDWWMTNYRPSLNWLMKPANFVKILDQLDRPQNQKPIVKTASDALLELASKRYDKHGNEIT